MKFKKLIILILATMFFGSSLLANSNKFVFNGLKLGDSLLKNYDKLEIEPGTLESLPANKYLYFQELFKEPVEDINAFTAVYKRNDKKYKIQSIILNKAYLNGETLESCRNEMDDKKNEYIKLLKPDKKIIQENLIDLTEQGKKIWKTTSDNKHKNIFIPLIGRDQQYYDTLKIECLFFTDDYKKKYGEYDRMVIQLTPHKVAIILDKQQENYLNSRSN